MSNGLAFYLVSILNTVSIPGRIVPAFLAGMLGPITMLLPAATITGVLALCWIGIYDKAGLIIFAILYGFFSGGFVSLPAVALTSLTSDLRTLGTRMVMRSVIGSLGPLYGTPVTSAILRTTGNYIGVQLVSGLSIFLTGVLLLITGFSKAGAKLMVKI
jgi:hypothetical protein